MRTLNQNKQKMQYALYVGMVEEPVLDKNGQPIVDYTDNEGNVYYRTESVKGYSEPTEFFGNIAMSGGEAEATEYGVDISSYSAILIVAKGLLPLSETSLIWLNTKPKTYDDGRADGNSADYRVTKVSPSLNYDKYLLQRVVK